MLNLFPIQWLALFAYAILRIVVGAVMIHLGLRHLRERSAIAASAHLPFFPFPKTAVALLVACELVAGMLVTAGAFTQIGALIVVVLSLKMLMLHSRLPHPSLPPRLVWVLLLGCGLSLFITGAGVFAFDLPI